jgi:hypothetical protein
LTTRSPRRRVSPLRLRLLGLVAISFMPIGLLLVRLADDERRALMERERETALRLLDVAVAEHRDLARGGRELLRHLSEIPEIAQGDPAICSRQRYVRYAGESTRGVVDAALRARLSSSWKKRSSRGRGNAPLTIDDARDGCAVHGDVHARAG